MNSLIEKLNKVKCRRLFGALLPLLVKIIEDETYNEEEEAIPSLQFIKLSADLLTVHISTISNEASDEVFEMATLLHDSLFPLHQCSLDSQHEKHAAAAKHAIFNLCEKWWHRPLLDREQLVTQLLPLLLLHSLDEHAGKSDVKRLYYMKDAFDLLDFGDESIRTLQIQLLRTVGHPLFLQCGEGKKFISHLLTLPELTGAVHAAVKVQIWSKKSILGGYAEIYWNARRVLNKEEGETEALEEAIQDLAYMTIHASNSTTSKNCRVILDKFLLYKKDTAVENMLYRIYGPLLWRSLICPNALVRRQSAVVLGDTFPLRGSGMEYEAVVKKSVEAIVKLMRDEVVNVRVAGCVCAGKVLGGFWVAIPSGEIRTLLNGERGCFVWVEIVHCVAGGIRKEADPFIFVTLGI